MAEIKIKMDKTAIIASSVIGSLGLLSAILGFAGEGANASYPAPGLGICAGIFLLVAQITVSVVGGCFASRAIPSETKRIVGIVCSVGSWITAVIACVLFFVFAAVSGGILAGAAVLTLIATALNITSVIMMQGQAQPADAVVAPDKQPDGVQTKAPNAIPVVQPLVPQPTPQNTAQPAPSSPSTAPLLQANQQVPLNPQSSPPAPAAQVDRSHTANQQSPPQGQEGDAATPAAADDASKASVEQQLRRDVQMVGQPQVLPPQPHAQPQPQPLPVNGTPQYTVHAPPLQVQVEVPGPISSPTAPSTGNGPTLKTTIRNELVKATVRLTEKAVEHVLFSNNTATAPTTTAGDILLSMMTDPTGADVGATDCGDSAV